MIFEVGYDIGDGYYSINMIDGGETLAKLVAEEHAKKHGYTVSYITPLADYEVEERKHRGMPLIDGFDYWFSKNSKESEKTF